MIYVLTMWDQKRSRHCLILNGPFASQDDAGRWGEKWDGNKCPMWQVVDIADTKLPVLAV